MSVSLWGRGLLVLLVGVLLSACQSTPKYADLPDSSIEKRYQGLSLVEAEDGTEVLRSFNPKIQQYSFDKLVLDPVTMYPKPQESSDIPVAVLDETDGLSLSTDEWRFNVRKSNTEPLVRLNAEAHNPKILVSILDDLVEHFHS